jgi:DNA-binding NarL/FixJ family response regulator
VTPGDDEAQGAAAQGAAAQGAAAQGAAAQGGEPEHRLVVSDAVARRLAADGRKLRILVIDDHSVVHWGFRLMLGSQPWVERCLSARNSEEAYAQAARYDPHVALVDLFIGSESGPEICEQLRERAPSTRVLLISGAGRISPTSARAAGALGFIPKDWPASDIAVAVRMVALGIDVFPPATDGNATPLSAREREVLDLVANGSTNSEIADALHLSPHTIKEHTSALYRKLKVRNRAEAVQRAQRLGLLG